MKPTAILIGLVFAAAATVILAQESALSLARVGGISGENGLFALQGARVSVYSDRSVYLQSGEDRAARLLDHDGPVSVEIQHGNLRPTTEHLPKGEASWFQLCDGMNQIANPGVVGMSPALPSGAKIKQFDKLADHFWLVFASSVVGAESLWTSIYLLRQDALHHFAVVQSDTVSASGLYCGTESMDGGPIAILVSEIAKSNKANFSSIYFYQIKREESESRKMGGKSEK